MAKKSDTRKNFQAETQGRRGWMSRVSARWLSLQLIPPWS